MPEWIHERAKHILAKNPSMPESEAWAVATQQSHSLGKSPKSYGTKGGRETAKAKYDTPKDDKKAANPGNLESAKMAAFLKAADGEFKLQGHTKFQELPIAIENRKGSVRSGVDKDGTPWRTVMKLPYGYIKGSKGADGEGVDVYVGPKKDATHAYVVHQHKADGTGYDEDKVMLGFAEKGKAIKAYLQHYDSPKFLGPVKEVPMDRLKELLSTGKRLTKISSPMISAMADELSKIAVSELTMAGVANIAKQMHALPSGTKTMLNEVARAKGMHPTAAFQLASASHGGQGVHNFLAGLPETAHLPSHVRDLGKSQALDQSLAGLKDMKVDLAKGGLVAPGPTVPRPRPGARPPAPVAPVAAPPAAAPAPTPLQVPRPRPRVSAPSMLRFQQRSYMLTNDIQKQIAKLAGNTKLAESLESNDKGTVAGDNQVGKTRQETPGALEGYWGEDPPKAPIGTTERDPRHEALNTAAEKINAEDNHDLLDDIFQNMANASETDKKLIQENFANGKPGSYVTRSKTLVEMTRGLLPKLPCKTGYSSGTRAPQETHAWLRKRTRSRLSRTHTRRKLLTRIRSSFSSGRPGRTTATSRSTSSPCSTCTRLSSRGRRRSSVVVSRWSIRSPSRPT